MTNKKKKTINIAKSLSVIINSRDITDILRDKIKKTDLKSVNLDFDNVQFISRSAAHSLLLLKEELLNKKEISFLNTNQDIAMMLRSVAASRALPKQERTRFRAKKINLNSLLQQTRI